ncbi:hypothetical protein [Gulbenkiania mobilis]|uniref:hypothetical protein n=1 Tax=Gulbenkiania mobilis TaxID=397457 RepID=UPI00128FAB03|nr:hypothetical protein [Gulbenkiania mobilis]
MSGGALEAIVYRDDLVPGQRHFECAKLRGLISVQSCADRFSRAASIDRFVACRHCPIGYRHQNEISGEVAPSQRGIDGGLCTRCGRPSTRLVRSSGHICVSCFNRLREWVKGRNRKGREPIAYIPLRPRRVGVEVGGIVTWQRITSQTDIEPAARATRDGHKLHGQQPGRTRWNPDRQAFEYVDAAGRVLLELEDGGRLHYVGVDEVRPGEEPAQVVAAQTLLPVQLAARWLAMTGGEQPLTGDYCLTALCCEQCHRGVFHARKRHGKTEVRCSHCHASAGFYGDDFDV